MCSAVTPFVSLVLSLLSGQGGDEQVAVGVMRVSVSRQRDCLRSDTHLLPFKPPCSGIEHVDTCLLSLLLSLPSHHPCYDNQHVSFCFLPASVLKGTGIVLFSYPLQSGVLHSSHPPFFLPTYPLQENWLACAEKFSPQVILKISSLLSSFPKVLIISFFPTLRLYSEGEARHSLSVRDDLSAKVSFTIFSSQHNTALAEVRGGQQVLNG